MTFVFLILSSFSPSSMSLNLVVEKDIGIASIGSSNRVATSHKSLLKLKPELKLSKIKNSVPELH